MAGILDNLVSGAKNAISNAGTAITNHSVSADSRRARLRPKPAAMSTIIGNSPILAPLVSSNGMVWPYQPTVSYQQDVSYQEVSMTHTNQEFYAYTKTNATKLTCGGEFSIQSQEDGLYALACLHFLRTVTKMYFGQGANLGVPPPVLLFDAFGEYMFNQLPVIITSFTSEMPKEGDYVPIDVNGRKNWLPVVFAISVSMTVQNTPARLRQFDLDKFRNGTMLTGGWI